MGEEGESNERSWVWSGDACSLLLSDVIHTVGPSGPNGRNPGKLRDCYVSCLDLLAEDIVAKGTKEPASIVSVAPLTFPKDVIFILFLRLLFFNQGFCCIGVGYHGFPQFEGWDCFSSFSSSLEPTL